MNQESHWTELLYHKLSSKLTEAEATLLKGVFERIRQKHATLTQHDWIKLMKKNEVDACSLDLNEYVSKQLLTELPMDKSLIQLHALIPTCLKKQEHLVGAKSIYSAGSWRISLTDSDGNEVQFKGDFGDRKAIFEAIHLSSSIKQQMEMYIEWLLAKLDD